MFGTKKTKIEDRVFGALRSSTPALAPRMEFEARGRAGKVDLRRYCSPIEDQMTLGSCNACAVVGALEFLMNKNGMPFTDLSVLYVYYYGRKLGGKESEDAGLLCHHATAAVMAYGACEDKLWPYKVDRFDKEPPRQAQEEASRFDVVQYARLGTSDAAKMSLNAGVPVVFGFDIPRPYYDGAAGTGLMPAVGTFDREPMAGHAMLIVGYDDQEGTWLARNSWGEEFGDKGYCRIPYGLAEKYVWNDELWAIGALENIPAARLTGPSVAQAVQDVKQSGQQQMRDALSALGKEIREDLGRRLDTAKTSIRDRLRQQEEDLAKRRNREGGGGQGGGNV
jgi:hypothetical protein